MTWVATSIGASAVIGYFGQQDASNKAEGRSKEQMAQQERYNQLRDPFSMGGNRQRYVGQLNELMLGGPASMESDPLYAWMKYCCEEDRLFVTRTLYLLM